MSDRVRRSNIRGIDVHTRKLRYFLAAADELHFSRAAARVFLTQQGLSRQIKELEEELGVRLFERTTRTVTLTAAGAAFVEVARRIVDDLDVSVADVRRADRALTGRIRLGFCAGAALELTGPILSSFRETYPEVTVDMREFPQTDPSAGLASGVTDIAIIRLPQGTAKIETEPLFVDPVIAAVADSHPLSAQSSATVAELLEWPLTLSGTSDDVYRAFWGLVAARPPGVPGQFVPFSSVTEELALVAAGSAIAITSAAVPTYAPMKGVRYVEVTDWPGSIVALAWHTGERSPAVTRFVDNACRVRDDHVDLVQHIENRRLAKSP
ncbi:LysR family transcriptional regulator [Nocardioides jejuensis]|uniref:LysR family transcriptional regulator n=1 Tax=Nocardioides jejuensis TaxID=2502782 RepID=A0A4R1CKB8_9ACTN|nr:LysR family transcriptional regulator [Nocardioides jejuensis]TCJ30636.1 LysR family transcriptional regulator [Nocardioides jejuensis]